MVMRKLIFVLFSFLFLIPAGNMIGQSLLKPTQEVVPKADTVKKAVKAIPLNSINNVSAESFALFSRLNADFIGINDRTLIASRVDSVTKKINTFFADTSGADFKHLNFREYEILGNSILLLKNDITTIQSRINLKLQALEKGEIILRENKQQWILTYEENFSRETPEAIMRRILSVINHNDSVFQILQKDIDFLLTHSDKVTGQQIRLDQFENELETYRKISSSNVFRVDGPPIWAFFSGKDSTIVSEQWQLFRTNFRDDSNVLLREYSGRLIFLLFYFILLVAFIYWLRATVKDPDIKEKKVILSLYVNEIFQKPFEVCLLIGLYFVWIIIPEMPTSYGSFLAIISVYAILRLAIDIMPHGYRKFLFGFAIAFILLRFYSLFYDQNFFSRLMLLAAQVIAIIYLLKFVKSRRITYAKRRSTFNNLLTVLSVIYLAFLFVALIGNIAGTISFSEFLSTGIIRSGFLIITTYVGFQICSALVFLLLSSPVFQGSNIIQKQAGYIFTRFYRLLRLFFVLSWFYIGLDHFKTRQMFFEWGSGFMTREIQVGEATFSLINIILFFTVILLSIWISRVIRVILNEEVFPRVKVERGIPGTVIMLLRITIISIGFLLAAAAAGMKLSNLTIILGAFSVGIGFGLQNIFNNLVSGLILAFERPIKEGDILEVNSLLGTVKKIGIRASVIRTFAGAEVIVPNGELISNDLINWTLSDQFRRADIRVGVAYGTDPEKVIKLLIQVAGENKRVNPFPAPQAFFIEFGDSSLNFRLLAWIDQDYRFEVESELMVDINRKLKESGIEIPFPQRDLHLKTITDSAGKKLKGK